MNVNVTIPKGLPVAADTWGEDIDQAQASATIIQKRGVH